VCLEAVVGQVVSENGLVELVIADNASDDGTAILLASLRETLGSSHIRIVSRAVNVGPVQNVVQLALGDARGEYVMVIGDDDLISAGAIRRIVCSLMEREIYDVFYTNFCVEHTNERWPSSAREGFPFDTAKRVNDRTDNYAVDSWVQLLDSRNEMCTHIYSHIVRRRIWVDFWKNRAIEEPYSSVYSTYPHTAMLLEAVHDQPAFYLGCPSLTAFYHSASWSAARTQVFLTVLPELYSLAVKKGLPQPNRDGCHDWVASLLAREIVMSISARESIWLRHLCVGIVRSFRNPGFPSIYLRAIKKAGRKRCLRFLGSSLCPFWRSN
jgi:glycosyltransferase involved in cell wall biosynthesis